MKLTPWLLLYIYFLTAPPPAPPPAGMWNYLCDFFILLLNRCFINLFVICVALSFVLCLNSCALLAFTRRVGVGAAGADLVAAIDKICEQLHTDYMRLRISLMPHATHALGTCQLASMQAAKNDFSLQVDENLCAVLSSEEMDGLQSCANEAAVVAFMTQKLSNLMGPKRVVVNSESLRWLETGHPSMKLKPDLFVAPKWAYTARKLEEERIFGVISDKRLYDTIYVLNCTCNCTPTALGELIVHLQHLNSAKTLKLSHGMLFGKSEFWLVKVQGLELIYRMVGNWTTQGSAQCISDFFEPLIWDSVVDVCERLALVVPNPTTAMPSAFLGAGTFGRVLRVRVLNDETEVALKVAISDNAAQLRREHTLLKLHQKTCGCSLIVSTSTECVTLVSGFSGYAMSPVGLRCVSRDRWDAKKSSDVLMSLHALHQPHKTLTVHHGDPRLPNLIEMPDSDRLVWIDFSHEKKRPGKISCLGVFFPRINEP
jgi:hypothetical protein